MPLTATPRPTLSPEVLRQRFASIRRQLRFVISVRGISWLLAVVLSTVVVTGLLDWRFHLPPLVRAVLLVSTLVTAGLIVLRYLLAPLTSRNDDLTLALRVENHFSGFNDALASTVQFLDQGSPPSTLDGEPIDSASLRRAAVQRTLSQAQGLDFNRVVDRRGLRSAWMSAAAAMAVTAALIVLYPTLAATALVRFAAPFGIRDWPRQTRIEVETPRQQIGRNEAFEVRGRLSGVIPQQATVAFHFDGLPSVTLTAEVVKENAEAGRLLVRMPPDRIQRSFRFQVSANDATSEEFSVTVLPPPVLVLPSPYVRLFFPKYTDLPSPLDLPAGTGNVEATAGTIVSLRARADRPLRRAVVEFLPENKFIIPALYLAPLGACNGLGIAAALAGGQTVWAPVPATFEEDQCAFTVDFLPRVSGFYVLSFEDESGLANSRLFELRLHPDPAPTVQLERPSPGRDLLNVLPEATLPLHAIAEDPLYAVRSVFLEYRTDRQETPHRLSLYDASMFANRIASAAGSGVLAAGLRPRPTRVEINQPLPLKALTHNDGTPLHEGDILLLTVCADDFDDVTFDKQPGRSHEVEVRILDRETLDVVLNQEQMRLQQDLLRLREKEREALAKVTTVENDLKKGKRFGPNQFDQVLQAEQAQQQVREQIGTEKEGVRTRVERILETLRQNGSRNSPVRDRVEEVARELGRLSANELEQAEAQLANARNHAELQEEKTSPEQRSRSEARAREAKQEARAAEKASQDKAAEASRAKNDEEAKQLRRQAEEQKKKARELLQEAARERCESSESPGLAQSREALADARLHQEEVEKTLTDLLQRMEPWTNSREIKGEAGHLLQEQQKLQAAAEELAGRKDFPQGESGDKLTESQQAELDNQRDAQKTLAERMNQLLDKMQRVTEDRKDKDPEMAKVLQDARDRAMKENISGQMRDAVEQLGQNQLGKAQQSQKASVAGLKQLLKDLEDRREAELERLAKKMHETEKELNQLFEEQERLKKKMKAAESIADPKQRQEALQALHRQQQELQKMAQDLLQQLTRDRNTSRLGQALGSASETMERAAQQLSRGEKADEAMEETLDRLDEARAEAEQTTDRTEDELGREQRARVTDVLKRLKERQEALCSEADRVQQKVRRALENKEATRSMRSSLRDLAGNQKDLGNEVAEVAKKELTGVPIFGRLVKRAAETMEQAGDRLDTLAGKLPEASALPDETVAGLQSQALRRFDQVIEALKDDNGGGRLSRLDGGSGRSGGSGGDDGIPPTAQLKVLRKVQKDVNQRTEAFVRNHPDLKKIDGKAKAELQDIQRDQQDVAELLEQLRNGGAPDAPEGEKP